jgi:hypothetical protein
MSHAVIRNRTQVGPAPGSSAIKIILIVALAANLAGFLVYKRLTKGAVKAPVSETVQPAVPSPSPAPPPGGGLSDLARAHRASGLAALEAGDYPAAVREFTQSLRRSDGSGDSAELLRIAKDLQERAAKPRSGAAPAAPPAPAPEADKRGGARTNPQRTSSRPGPKGRLVAAASSLPAGSTSAAEEESGEEGLVLVTSSPPGLLVQIDGKSVDLTPAKVKVDSGSHLIALYRGSQRLHERRVEVNEGGVHALDVDLTAQLRANDAFDQDPPPARQAEKPKEKPAPAGEPEEPLPEPDVPAAPAPGENRSPPTPVAPSATGELHITSGGVFGDVWINGMPFGPPPVLAKKVPAGQAKVEIRVGGTTRRSKQVEVVPSRRTTLKIR